MRNMYIDEKKLSTLINLELENHLSYKNAPYYSYNFLRLHDYLTNIFKDLMFLTFELDKFPLTSISEELLQNDKKYNKVLDSICLNFDSFYYVLVLTPEFLNVQVDNKKSVIYLIKKMCNGLVNNMGFRKYYILFNRIFDVAFSICSSGKEVEKVDPKTKKISIEKKDYSYEYLEKKENIRRLSKPYIKKILNSFKFESKKDVLEDLEEDIPLLLSILINIIEKNGGKSSVTRKISKNEYIIFPFFEVFRDFFVRLFSEFAIKPSSIEKNIAYTKLKSIFSDMVSKFYEDQKTGKIVEYVFSKIRPYLDNEISDDTIDYFSRESDIKDEHFIKLSKASFLDYSRALWDKLYHNEKILNNEEMNIFLSKLYTIAKFVVMYAEKTLVPMKPFGDFNNSEDSYNEFFPINLVNPKKAFTESTISSFISSEIKYNIFIIIFKEKFGDDQKKYEELYQAVKTILRNLFSGTKYFNIFENIFSKVDLSIKEWIDHITKKDNISTVHKFDENVKLTLGGPLLYEVFTKRK